MAKKYIDEYVPINGILQYFLHIPNDSKDVIIMLHGGPGIPNSRLAYFHQPYMDFCNVVYYDQRWAGRTQQKNKTTLDNVSVEILLSDLKETVKYVKEKYHTNRVFLAGHSCGSLIGTRFIIEHPHDVAGYIGYGQMIDSSQDRSWYEHLSGLVMKSGKKADIKKLETVDKTYPKLPKDKYIKATLTLSDLEYKFGFKKADYVSLYLKSPTRTLKDIFQMIQMARGGKVSQALAGAICYDYDFSNIKEYQTPVYYVLGKHDEWTTSKIAAEYFETIQAPKKGLYWVDAGHMVDTDNPADFFKIIKEIITTQAEVFR